MLTMFYLNVFSLPTLKDVVGHYKLWNEVMFWLNTNCVLQCFNTFHCLQGLIRPEMQVNEIHALYDNLFFILCKLLNNIFSCILLKWLVL